MQDPIADMQEPISDMQEPISNMLEPISDMLEPMSDMQESSSDAQKSSSSDMILLEPPTSNMSFLEPPTSVMSFQSDSTHSMELPQEDETSTVDMEEGVDPPRPTLYIHYPALDNIIFSTTATLDERIQGLQQFEMQSDRSQLDARFFSHMLLCYLVRGDWNNARQCRFRASESSEVDVSVNTLALVSQHLEKNDHAVALSLIKQSHLDYSLKDLVRALKKRIILSVLQMIEQTYINIEVQKLAGLLDAKSNDELKKILDMVGWSEVDGFVTTQKTPQFLQQIDEMNAPQLGSAARDKPEGLKNSNDKNKHMLNSVDPSVFQETLEVVDLHNLVQYATFLELNA